MSKNFLLRVRSREGTSRISCAPGDTVLQLKQKVESVVKVSSSDMLISLDLAGKKIFDDASMLDSTLGLRHGDLVYATFKAKEDDSVEEEKEIIVIEDEVDILLAKESGWIDQKRDERMCRHPTNGSCVVCMPIAPWLVQSLEPWKSEKLKHIPFTSWLRKHDQDRGVCRHVKRKGYYCQNCRPLDIISYATKVCDRHEPWPGGICSYCKPDTIRIARQVYRHVDHVVFESKEVLGSLIGAWRATGKQRAAYLFGKYVPHPRTPLGIQCVVEAMYEPPQICSKAGLQLSDDKDAQNIIEFAKKLGLVCVGFAWTAINSENGKVIESRNLDDSFLVSGAEMLQAAIFQNENPSPCKQSMSGVYGSKWISVLITGNADGDIIPTVFQASDQMTWMVRDGLLTINKEDGALMERVENPKIFVPKVLYDDTNEYKRQVVKEAMPSLPHIPFYVDVSFGIPNKPNPMFPTNRFPIENRSWKKIGLKDVNSQIHQTLSIDKVFKDFHFLWFLNTLLDKETMDLIFEGILKKDGNSLKKALTHIKPLVEDQGGNNNNNNNNTNQRKNNNGGKHPKEIEWMNMLMSMGFSEKQSKDALVKSNYSSVEAALDKLM